MPISTRDHRYTISLAEDAVNRIKALQLPGDPPSFELWYTYVGRYIPALNRAINELLAKNGTLSAHDVDRIYDHYLGTFRITEQVEKIGTRVGAEIDHAVGTIDAAIDSAARHRDNLASYSHELDKPADPAATRRLVEAVVSETRAAVAETESHRETLKAARAQIDQMRKDLDAIRRESRTDALTALANRKQFDQSLVDAIRHATDTARPLSLLMYDVDHFKSFNDNWGHPVGDDVLRLIARVSKETARMGDTAARYGGEEFAVILPNTPLAIGVVLAERLRSAIATMEVMQRSTNVNLGRVTVSIGVAQWQAGETARDLIERADACLYAAKRQGRNRVACTAEDAAQADRPVAETTPSAA